MDEIWRKKRKMDEDNIEELVDVIVPAGAALWQVKESEERTKSKVRNKSWWIEGYNNWDDKKAFSRI